MLKNSLLENELIIDELINIKNAFDLGKRRFHIQNYTNIIYYSTFLVNSDEITQILLNFYQTNNQDIKDYFDYFKNNIASINVSTLTTFKEVTNAIFNGLVVFIVDDNNKAIAIDLRRYPGRSIDEPDSEKVVRGSKEGFNENISINLALIRRRIKSDDLVVKKFEIGEYSKTLVSVVYLDQFVNKKALNICLEKINKLNIKELTMTDKALEELLTNRPYSPFPIVRYTERPDTVAIHLYQGQFCIIVDTSPSVMLAPTTLFDHLQAPEEYRQTPVSGTYLRILRFIGIIISLLLVPLWLSFYQTPVSNNIVNSLLNLEYSKLQIFIQLLIAEVSIELVRMASIHTPNSLSQSMGLIVGIILGGIGVELGIISEVVVLLGALSAIGSYITPSYELSLANKIVKLILIIISYFFGFIGLLIAIICFTFYLATLRSFNEPYLYPLIPLNFKMLLNQFIRLPYQEEKKIKKNEKHN